MSEARQVRRAVHGLAGIVLAVLATTSGCTQLPVPRANTTPVHIPPPRPVGTPVPEARAGDLTALDEREILPPLPPLGAGSSVPVVKAGATPILDETLARIQGETQEREDARTSEPEDESGTEAGGANDEARGGGPPAREQEPSEPTEPKTAAVEALERPSAPAPARSAIDPERVAKPADPRELWREGVARLQNLAGEQVKTPGPDPGAWSLRARLIDLVARSEASEDLVRNPVWRLALSSLTAGTTAPDDRARAAQLRAAIDALEDEVPLQITDLQLCRKVNGFGEFEAIDTAACRPGHAMIVYCEMSGLHYAAAGERFRSKLTSSVELVPASGGEPVWTKALGTAEDTCRRRRRDYYVNYRIVLAESLPPGPYELRLKQTDETDGRSTASSIALTVQP